LHRSIRFEFAGLVLAAILTGCGGGGDSPAAPATSPEGVYSGSITSSTVASAFSTVVLEDGQVWTIYGNTVGGVLVVNGLIQGQGTSSNGTFTSSTMKDFGASPALAATLNATYVQGASLAGTITEAGGSIGFSGTATPATTFDYNTPAQLSNVVGAWTLSSTSGNTIALTVSATGAFTGTATGGCSVSGTFTPRPSGKNIFNFQMTIGPAPCTLAGWTGGGIAIYSTLANGSHQLIVGSADASRTYGTASIGTR
jgi:hypothetical protein